MIKDRKFALIFRAIAALFSLLGILATSGIFKGTFSFGAYLFYTTQSNILICGLFVYFLVKTILDYRKNGRYGFSSYAPRLHMYFTVAIIITFLVFWTMLAPTLSFGSSYLLTFDNLSVHTITPLLAVADYILFTKSGHLKKRDIFICMIIPVIYFIQATILGFSGVEYYVLDEVTYYFPYFFIDYYNTGALVAVYVVVILAFFMLLAFGMYMLDRKWKKPELMDKGIIDEN